MRCRLVDTDCKWGLNRAGRPPDPFWEVCGRSVPRKILTSHDKVRWVHLVFRLIALAHNTPSPRHKKTFLCTILDLCKASATVAPWCNAVQPRQE